MANKFENIPKLTAKIDQMLQYENSKVKAIASVSIGNVFAVHGIKVIEGPHGLFLRMPQSVYEKNGTKQYQDLFHPVTAEARQAMDDMVLSAYQVKRKEMEAKLYSEELPFQGQQM